MAIETTNGNRKHYWEADAFTCAAWANQQNTIENYISTWMV
jgi:hypothetical protein